jgi:hypothetical protein
MQADLRTQVRVYCHPLNFKGLTNLVSNEGAACSHSRRKRRQPRDADQRVEAHV